MKNNTLVTLLSTALIGFSGSTLAADSWAFLPATDDNYKADMSVSIIGGNLSPDANGSDSGTATGIELALLCPLFQVPGGDIRQQISYTRYDESDVEITSLELNPHYMFEMSQNFQIGVGPGLGYVTVDNGMDDASFFALQLGVSAHYRIDKLFLGAEIRQQLTTEEEISGVESDMDNSRSCLKQVMYFNMFSKY